MAISAIPYQPLRSPRDQPLRLRGSLAKTTLGMVLIAMTAWDLLVMSPAFAASDLPVYVAKQPNLHDYQLFANNGWDGNWFVGYNTSWIKRLPPIPAGAYERAYVGVKLGRMKSLPGPAGSKAWERRAIPGNIFAALSSTPSWTTQSRYVVTTTEDIPLEGQSDNAIEGVGESQWFWTPVSLNSVSTGGILYVAVWADPPELVTISSCPVIAAAWSGKDQDTWLAQNLTGAPPKEAEATLKTPISFFQPAIALKLIPQGASHRVAVRIADWKAGTPDHLKPTILADVSGDGIEKVWVEYGRGTTWTKIGRPIWQPPYQLTLEQGLLPKGKTQLRVVASNVWEERGESSPFTIEVSPLPTKN